MLVDEVLGSARRRSSVLTTGGESVEPVHIALGELAGAVSGLQWPSVSETDPNFKVEWKWVEPAAGGDVPAERLYIFLAPEGRQYLAHRVGVGALRACGWLEPTAKILQTERNLSAPPNVNISRSTCKLADLKGSLTCPKLVAHQGLGVQRRCGFGLLQIRQVAATLILVPRGFYRPRPANPRH